MTAVLLNASTLAQGGALQVGVHLLHALRRDATIDWYCVLSPQVDTECRRMGIELDPSRTYRLEASPSRNRAARREVLRIFRETPVEAVLTVFGPAYVRFDKPHLVGVADPWVTHASWIAYSKLRRIGEYLETPLLSLYKGWWYRRADAWVVEAEVAKRGLHDRWGIPLRQIHVIPNSCGAHYRSHPFTPLASAPPGPIDVLTLSAYYAHKDLELIPAVAAWLAGEGHAERFRFHLTLSEDGAGWHRIHSRAVRLGVEDAIVNHGPVAVADGPALYDRCHVMFLPTLLETFSASYPEAMAAGRPIVTSDLPFAHANCGDAALFFAPDDAAAAGRALLALSKRPELWSDLVARGRTRLATLPDADGKYRLYVDAIMELLGSPKMQDCAPCAE